MDYSTQALGQSVLQFSQDVGITFTAAYVGALLGLLLFCIVRRVLSCR